MAQQAAFQEPQGSPAQRWTLIVLAVAAALALIWYLYGAFTGVTGVKVDAPTPQVVDMLPPPPPPPPPPPKPQEKPPEPTDAPKPVPEAAATPKPDAPAPMTMNADAQAGPGSIAAGSGAGAGAPGGTGTCIGLNCGKPGGGLNDGVYRQYLSSILQQAVYRDDRSRKFASSAEFEILVSSSGAIERVALRASSGKRVDDETLQDILQKVRGLRPPPYAQRYPVVIRVRGRQSL